MPFVQEWTIASATEGDGMTHAGDSIVLIRVVRATGAILVVPLTIIVPTGYGGESQTVELPAR